jgi:hypothetical protein
LNDGIRVSQNEGWNKGQEEQRMDLGSGRMKIVIVVYKVDD